MLFGLTVLLPSFALGQDPPPIEAPTDASRVEVGDTVRVRLPMAQPVQAVFKRWDAEVMLLQVDGMAQDWPVSIYDMVWLEIHTRRTRREGLRHYAILGAATGLFVGVGVGLGLHSAGVIDDPEEPPGQVVTNALRWAGFGTVGGVLVGGFFGGRNPGTGWISLSLPSPGS